MVAEYRKRGHAVTPVIWSRGDAVAPDANTVTCAAKGAYGRRLKGLTARLTWMWFLATWMIRNRRSYDIVHTVDLDTGIVAVPLSHILRKPAIYDAFDHIMAITGGGLTGTILASVERWAIKQAAITIFPDPNRLQQYGVTPDDRITIVSNIPDVEIVVNVDIEQSEGSPMRLVYIGTLEAKHRGLEYLPDLCARLGNTLEVIVGGTGALHAFFAKAASEFANLTYVGHRDYTAALRLMSESDCLYGPYLLSAPAHRFASPNKMYEHLALGKPLITNVGTPPADLVAALASGFLFDGSFGGLYDLVRGLKRNICQEAGDRAAMAWRNNYAGMRAAELNYYFKRFDQVVAFAAGA